MWNALKKWLGIDTEPTPVAIPETKTEPVKVKKAKKEKSVKVPKTPKAKKPKSEPKTETTQATDSVALATSEKQGS